jgi:N6-adenosine-specific RNA methylase IME4
VKFQVICADPPWAFDDKLARMKSPTRRGAASQYSTLSLADIAALKVQDLINPAGCVLALWVPSTLLLDGIRVMQAWGFVPKSTVVWVKTSKKAQPIDPATGDGLAFGMGRTFRAAHEIALIGTAGKSVYPTMQDHSQRSVIMAPNMGHSQKPDELQLRLEKMWPDAQRLELFARRTLPNWTCVGDGIDGLDIRDAIHQLTTL